MTQTPLLVIAAGGTGGHMFPAQALAETMLARGWRVRLASDARGLRYAGGFPEAVERLELSAASPGVGGLTGLLAAPVAILRGMAQAAVSLRRDRPVAVAGFGGYPSFPTLAAARAMGIPFLIHEQNGILGSVNRRFARSARAVACGVWPVAGAPGGATLTHVGNPVRRAVLDAMTVPCDPPGDGPLRLLVFGGSQGARALSRVVPEAVALLPEGVRSRLSVAHQAREEDASEVTRIYAGAGLVPEVAPFFEDMAGRIAAAHLVVARAGASTVAELTAIGRPSILVPYPHAAADHQTANARALADAGAALMTPEAGLAPETLARDLEALLTDAGAARRMADAARALGRPEAAETLADMVGRIAGR